MAPAAHRCVRGSDASRTALRDLVSAHGGYGACDRPKNALVGGAASLVKMVSGTLAEAPRLGEDGGVTDAIGRALKKAMKVLMALEAV